MKKSRTLLESFTYAIAGIAYSLKTQRNMRIHCVMAILVLTLGPLLELSSIEMIVVLLTIAMVILAEMINTAIETTIDLFTKDYHPLAKVGKNVAAGAVLIAAINAVAIGYIVFYKKIYKLIVNLIGAYL